MRASLNYCQGELCGETVYHGRKFCPDCQRKEDLFNLADQLGCSVMLAEYIYNLKERVDQLENRDK